MSAVEGGTLAANVPGRHAWQAVAPAVGATDPIEHGVQSAARKLPLLLRKLPGGQAVQKAENSVAAYEPAAQGVHALEAGRLQEPGGHRSHWATVVMSKALE